jgi:uncharacterized protein
VNILSRFFIGVGVVLLLTLGTLAIQQASAQEQEPPTIQNNNEMVRTVTVTGVGLVGAVPDTAYVQVGVQSEAETASRAIQENSRQMQDLLRALRQAGANSQDIQTQTIQLYPRYDPQPDRIGEPELTGYVVINIVEVRVRTLTNLGKYLDAAVSAGGNTIQGIRFEVSRRQDYLTQGREQAMQQAREKAEHLAGLANDELGDVISIRESTWQPVFMDRAMGAGAVRMDVPVEPGRQAVEVEIQVTWALR